MARDSVSADSVVVELEAKLDGYQRDVQRGASTFDRSMKQIEGSATRAERSVGRSLTQAGQSSRLLGYQIADIGSQLASGSSPFLILAQQAPQVANALDGTTGAAGKMATFFSGPWGAALLAAGSILGTVIGKLIATGDETGKALKKLQEHARETAAAEKAQAIFANTLDGVTEALRKNREALDQLDAGQKTAARQTLENAIASKLRLEGIRNETQGLITLARAELEVQRTRASGPGQRGELAALGLEQKTSSLDALERRLGGINAQIAEADKQISDALSHRVVELEGRDKIQRITDQYKGLVDAARARATAEERVNGTLARQVRLLNQKRDAEIKAYQDSQRTSSSANRQTGREVTASEAASIARAAGLRVNSASRTYGQQKALYDAWVAAGMPKDNPVAKPGSSAHEGARGRWALDIQLAPGVTPELLRKVFSAQGINLTKVFLERGHFHVEGSRAQADAEAAVRDRDIPKYTAAQMRDLHSEFYESREKGPLELFDTDDLTEQADQLAHLDEATTSIADIIANFPPIPDLSKIITEEEQNRIEGFAAGIERDLAGGIADAIVQGRNLGDVLVNTFKRVAAAIIESGILNLLSGGKEGVSFAHIPGRASGGNVSAGQLYRVNEAGMEAFRPAGSGTIIPLGQMAQAAGGGAGGLTVVVNVHANDAVLADTVRGWVAQGVQEATARGAVGGRALALDTLRRQRRRSLVG
jgi:hypothetical protein